CAREALAALGRPPAPLLRGERGMPEWPDGVVGSITHCEGYRAAVVAPATTIWTIGVDAEPDQPLPDGVLGAVALPAERGGLQRLLAEDPRVNWERLLFSAKEAVYKAWFPLTRRWLDFTEAHVTIDPAARRFDARLLVDADVDGQPLTGFAGRFAVARGLIITAVAVPVTVGTTVSSG
ncbi:MAG TPA: 4'-phosphopantetheinyl transferase superfamily protein, partial [Actinoplanes sp.]|nr:4'-phosphopantetheinyl transferase superfamily protein [Actinoplanes sp.]